MKTVTCPNNHMAMKGAIGLIKQLFVKQLSMMLKVGIRELSTQ